MPDENRDLELINFLAYNDRKEIKDTYGNEGTHEEEIEKNCVYCGWNFTGLICPNCRHGIDGVYYGVDTL